MLLSLCIAKSRKDAEELLTLVTLDNDLSFLGRASDTASLTQCLSEGFEVSSATDKACDERHLLASSLLLGERETESLLGGRECLGLFILLCRIFKVRIGAIKHA
jgi:hypothetical protein